MEIKIINRPNRKITQTVLYFQFRFMGATPEVMEIQDDRFGSLPFGYVIGYEGDLIIGVTNLLKRNIKFKEQDITLGGFGGVCTHSEFRRQGIATKLLKEGMKILKDNKCGIAFLNTDPNRLASLYNKIGFVPLQREYKATGASGKIYLGKSGMIAPVCSKKIFKLVLKDTDVFDLQGQDW
jgi:ribosomal protein S18 acetylase RimI-like enzyme